MVVYREMISMECILSNYKFESLFVSLSEFVHTMSFFTNKFFIFYSKENSVSTV